MHVYPCVNERIEIGHFSVYNEKQNLVQRHWIYHSKQYLNSVITLKMTSQLCPGGK